VTTGVLWLVVFLLLVVAGIGGMFLYGWLRRKDKMPKVAPLPPEDDDVRPPLAVSQIEGHLGLADDDLVLFVEVLRIARRDLPQRPSLLHLDPAKAPDVLRDRRQEIAPEVGERPGAAGAHGARDLPADPREGGGHHDEQGGA